MYSCLHVDVRLKDLFKFLKVDVGARRKPQSEYEFARWCISHLVDCAFTDDETLQPYLDKRNMKVPLKYIGCLTTDAVEFTEGVLEADEQKAVRTVVERKKHEATKRAAAKVKGKKGTAAASSREPIRKLDKRRLEDRWKGGSIELDIAKLYLPSFKGITLVKDSTFHCRWKGYFPREQRPRISTKAWSLAVTQWSALLHVLRFLWKCYLEVHPHEHCLWDFDGMEFRS